MNRGILTPEERYGLSLVEDDATYRNNTLAQKLTSLSSGTRTPLAAAEVKEEPYHEFQTYQPQSQGVVFKSEYFNQELALSFQQQSNACSYGSHANTHESTGREITLEQTYAIDERLKAIRHMAMENNFASTLLEIETLLAHQLMAIDYGALVTHVYNPVDYAYLPHTEYYRKYCLPSAEVVMVGMNPGPFGMAQSGVSE